MLRHGNPFLLIQDMVRPNTNSELQRKRQLAAFRQYTYRVKHKNKSAFRDAKKERNRVGILLLIVSDIFI